MSDEKMIVQLTISEQAAQVLANHAPGERKKGEWLSQLLEAYGRGEFSSDGILERIEKRLQAIEQKIEKLGQ